MKIEKNKIVFGSVLAIVMIFIIGYSFLVFGEDDTETNNLKQTLVPDLEQTQADYSSKLEAIDDLKDVREKNAPSIYNEAYIDSLGYYDPDLIHKEKERIVDSIYNYGKINYSDLQYRYQDKASEVRQAEALPTVVTEVDNAVETKEMGLEHQLFFASNPIENAEANYTTDEFIYVAVDGNQVIKANHRLRMRITKDATIYDSLYLKNTPIYGFISFKANRAMIDIENIKHQPVKLKAYDFQDGSEGIYVENNFRADAKREVADDLVNDINIAGMPQLDGIKNVFRRSNRNVKVTVVNNYKLILKIAKNK